MRSTSAVTPGSGEREHLMVTVGQPGFRLEALASPTVATDYLVSFETNLGDRVIATAILDRVLHHAIILNIRGNSYRLKEKLKAGLVRAEEATA
jgi:hypothetical protein